MYLVFDVGGSAIKYALMKKHGDIAKKGSEPTHLDIPNGLEVFVKSIVDIYESFKGRETIDGIAMDLPGQIDVDNGIVYGGGALQFLDKVPLGKIISEKCDGINVALENDGKCAALAEAWQGNGKSYDNVFVMVFGTGVGGGLVVNQRVLRGANLSAGEISYFIEGMNMDHLETAFNYMENADRMPLDEFMKKMPYVWSAGCSTTGRCYLASKKKGLDRKEVDGIRLYKWVEEGDQEIIDLMEDWYFQIAKQCCNIQAMFDPGVILVGGGISAQPLFVEGIKRYIDKIKVISSIYEHIKIDTCKYMNDSNLLGALFNYRQKYEGR
ncbi:MAG: ROK family protein [Lachnospiraceae bacterium]|nr:ROK family protein [Lachnospiraceae bacterium]